MARMRKVIAEILRPMLVVLLVCYPVRVEGAEPIWKTIYREKIKEIALEYMKEGRGVVFPVFFYLVDIDCDGTPELAQWHEYDTDFLQEIYSVEGNQVVKLIKNNTTIGGGTEEKYIAMRPVGVSKDKTTGESVIVCRYCTRFSGTYLPKSGEYVIGEFRKTGRNLFFSERLIEKGTVELNDKSNYYYHIGSDYDLEGVYMTYYSSNGSLDSRILISEDEYNKQLEAYKQTFEKNPEATGRYILAQKWSEWSFVADFEPINLFTDEWLNKLESWETSDTDKWNAFIAEKGYAPFDNMNIDKFLDGFPANGGSEPDLKTIEPIDIIDNHPLYINFVENIESGEYQNRKAINRENFELTKYGIKHIVIVYCEADLYNFKISLVSDTVPRYFEDTVFSLDVLPSNSYIEYKTYIPETVSVEAVTFTDSNGERHSYLLGYNMRDGLECASKIDILINNETNRSESYKEDADALILLPETLSEPETLPAQPPDSPYIYDPPPKTAIFTPNSDAINHATDSRSAITQITDTINSLTEEQKRSGEVLDTVALFIETAVRKGAGKPVSGDVTLTTDVLSDLTNTAADIQSGADSALSQNNIELPRELRTNITILSDKDNELIIDLPDDVSAVGFDNVTIETPFAAVTLNKENIIPGGSVKLRKALTDNDTQGDGGSGGAQDSGGKRGPFDNPLNFWSIGAIALIFITSGILRANKKRLRAWVAPTFCVLAVAINVLTYILGRGTAGHIRNDNISGAKNVGDVYADSAYAIEITLNNCPKANMSLPADTDGDKDYLTLFNENGELCYSKYNPITDTIDASVRTSGIYTIKEYSIDFTDIEHKNALMQEVITKLASKGIMPGTAKTVFEPDKPINRAEFVSAIVKAFDLLDIDAQTNFTDTRKSDWYYSAIATAEKENLISGFEDNTFRGNIDIPKQQLVVVSANTLMEYMGYKIPRDIENELTKYLDRPVIADWAANGVALATQSGIMIYRADSLFAPQSVMTRGDAAIVLYRLFGRVW